MQKLAFRFALAALVAALLAPGVRADSWAPFTSQDGKFAASFPGTPRETTNTTSSPVGNVTSSTFMASAGGAFFSVTYTDLPEMAVMFGGDGTIYDNAAGDLLHEVVGRKTAMADTTVAGKPGKRLDYTTAGKSGDKPHTGQALMFLNGTRLYVIDALVPSGQEGQIQQFERSFRLLSN